MTSISSAGATSQPFGRVQNVLSNEASTGAISATDEAAMVSALGNIGAQFATGVTGTGTAGTTTSATGTGAPTSMADQVSSAIDGQVTNGTLTPDQATELKAAFGQVQAQMHGAHGMHGGHGHHGGGGEIAALLGSDTSTTTDATDPTTATNAASPSASPADPFQSLTGTVGSALQSFAQQFANAITSNATYGASGSAASNLRSVMVNLLG
jgi:hypothetical protein